ncbi:MAG: GNAT family N-acetyltransferase [Oligoflexia bacterium]|nr:GNAT family N-acetyltransferase [Oligoflexia bacterium]
MINSIEHSYHLVGNVKQSLKAAESFKKEPHLKISFTNSKEVKKRLVEIELQAFRDEPNSLPYDHIMRDPKTCARFCLANLLSSLVWKVTYKNEEIGLIAFKVNEGVAHIQTIALAKDYRHRGFGRLIYKEGLAGIVDHGARIYTGVSATKSVLENAKYLNRRVYNINFKQN